MEILSRLPVESLLRFKCMCKAWSVLIEDPGFINWRLKKEKTNRLFLLTGYAKLGRTYFIKSAKESYPRTPPLEKFKGNIFVYGSCNGIICLGLDTVNSWGKNKRDVALWNPATRGFRILPEDLPPNLHCSLVAFGFDQENNDYKVLKIPETDIFGDFSAAKYWIAVYSLTTDSWRQVEAESLSWETFNRSRLPSYLNGVYYWIASAGKEILAFDMPKEAFSAIQIPPFDLNLALFESVDAWEVTVLNDYLALVLTCKDVQSFHIWLFDINNNFTSKYATMKHLPVGNIITSFETFLGFWIDCNVVVIIDGRGEVFLYNRTSQEINRMFKFECNADPRLITYAESLTLVGGKREFG